ncbi:hypothetical protein PC122_g9325 [Phytophthora cactorum]|nr:hypothetical protein PC122_g9325 [Phytophthora cactorum]
MVAVPLIQGATLAIALSSSASLHAATTTGALRSRSDIVNGTQPRFIYIGSSSLLGSIGIESSSHASSVMSTSLNPLVAAPVSGCIELASRAHTPCLPGPERAASCGRDHVALTRGVRGRRVLGGGHLPICTALLRWGDDPRANSPDTSVALIVAADIGLDVSCAMTMRDFGGKCALPGKMINDSKAQE